MTWQFKSNIENKNKNELEYQDGIANPKTTTPIRKIVIEHKLMKSCKNQTKYKQLHWQLKGWK